MRRKILIVSPFPPRGDAPNGGAQAIARSIAELAETNSVRVLCLRAKSEPPPDPALCERCESVEQIDRPPVNVGIGRAMRNLASFTTGRPFWVGHWRVEAFRRRLRETVELWRPDLVQFEFQVMAQYRDAVQGCRTILVVHEPAAAATRDCQRFAPAWQRWLLRQDASAWERFEREILSRFDAIVCLTDHDRSEMERLAPAGRKVVISPPSASIRQVLTNVSESSMVLFVGNFVHPPNLEAAVRLARDIFPGIRNLHPGATLTIVGGHPPRALRRFASGDIAITGHVHDIQPLLDSAALVAVPLRSGGGIRMKVIEALSQGKAVVASAVAARGLGLRDGHEFIQAESDQEFVAAIAALLKDRQRRRSLSENALEWAAEYSKPGRLRREYEALYSELTPVPIGIDDRRD